MNDVSKTILIGHLGQDPELRFMPDETPVCNFSVATSYYKKQNDAARVKKTSWHNIVVIGRKAETVCQYLSKGSKAYVEGRLNYRTCERNGINYRVAEIIAQDVQFLDRKPEPLNN